MEKWNSLLKADPLPWLLEPDNPSVRYFALKTCGQAGTRPEVIDAGRKSCSAARFPHLEKRGIRLLGNLSPVLHG